MQLIDSPALSTPAPPPAGFSCYAFAGVEGRAIAHSVFLDGNVFHDGPGVSREPWVGDFLAGGALAGGPFQIGITYVIRTKEFSEQNKHDTFGSLHLSYRF